jgi:biopolymer transport protein ExbB/TolQ
MVAIPAVIAYNFFQRATKVRMTNSEAVARIVSTYLARVKQVPGQASS